MTVTHFLEKVNTRDYTQLSAKDPSRRYKFARETSFALSSIARELRQTYVENALMRVSTKQPWQLLATPFGINLV